MKTVVRFVSNDGAEWRDEKRARKRDALLATIEDAVAGLLRPRPVPDPLCRFENGHGYVQQDKDAVRRYKSALLRIARVEIPEFAGSTQLGAPVDEISPHGIVARRLEECSPPIYAAWSRLMCIDVEGREWGQPYFALNPDKGEAFAIRLVDAVREV